jgi:hypothetical protein
MKLFQSFVNDHQKSFLSEECIPFDASNNTEDNQREYELFKKIIANQPELDSEPWGLVSWKFEHKCPITLNEFKTFATSKLQDGYDCVFINPMIGNESLYINTWEQGMHSGHFGMDKIAHFLQAKMGPFFDCYMDKNTFSLCNYFVAQPTFWKNYFIFADKAITHLEAEVSAGSEIGKIYSGTSHYVRNETLSMRPFIIERLFSSFLCSTNLKYISYNYDNDHYHIKFGKRLGDFLFKNSEKKNLGIKNKNIKCLEEYNNIRRSCFDQDFLKIATGLDDSLDIFLTKEYKNTGY